MGFLFNHGLTKKRFDFGRWIMESCSALSGISLEFAEHGAGLMPANVVAKLEVHYLEYRNSYNSFFGVTSTPLFWSFGVRIWGSRTMHFLRSKYIFGGVFFSSGCGFYWEFCLMDMVIFDQFEPLLDLNLWC